MCFGRVGQQELDEELKLDTTIHSNSKNNILSASLPDFVKS
jgi:hypothetical protein